MPAPLAQALLAPLALLVAASAPVAAQSGPRWIDEQVAGPFTAAVGLCFDPLERLWVWERTGRVWVVEDGQPAQLFINASQEVGSWGDHGLLGFAVDPAFDFNGFIYFYYVVDYHHLTKFGTPAYMPGADEFGVDTIARVVRYRVLDPHQLELGVQLSSRRVLIGDTISNGIPCCGASHCVGSLVFGEDGSLLVSTGDGSFHASSHTCALDGILRPEEGVGEFRAQMIDSHSGKVLRIDPDTGAGLPSNPWYDPAEPMAPRSRVWALGFRNPFRFTLRPGTGSPDPTQGDPGTLYLGDVGWTVWEELDVVEHGGQNFGWPLFEGYLPQPTHSPSLTANQDAPNPLFGQVVAGVGTCTEEFFDFQDLIRQEALAPAPLANPCNPAARVPGSLAHVHRTPALAWSHGVNGQAFVRAFNGQGALAPAKLGTQGAPVAGASFKGNCVLGGVWPTHGMPPEYEGTYFFADYGEGWIKNAVFDAADELVEVRPFADNVGTVVAMATHPSEGGIYYVRLLTPASGGGSTVHRIAFDLDGKPAPVAEPAVSFGASPLAVQFDGTASLDPEQQPLAFAWDFGDGTPVSRDPAPRHVFPAEDATPAAAVISRLDELAPFTPPFPQGGPGVVVDGVYPPPGTQGLLSNFTTYHLEGHGTGKNGLDWVGLEFAGERDFAGLHFQEGVELPLLGGWFLSLGVEVRDALSGLWTPVTGLRVWPPYAGQDGQGWDVYELTFDLARGDAVRLVGAPGGPDEFVTVGELRAVAVPLAPPPGPRAFPVALAVTDAADQTAHASALVSTDNTPPLAAIALPPNGAPYDNDAVSAVQLEGAGLDAEHARAELACEWRVILHHGNHVHPEDPVLVCDPLALVLPHGLSGDSVWYELRLTVTDPQGLQGTATHWMHPADDCNLNGLDDLEDVLFERSADRNGNLVPDECERDCDGDGLSDGFTLAAGLADDCDGDGRPDPCQSLPDCDGDGVADTCAIAAGLVADADKNGVPDPCQVAQPVDHSKPHKPKR